MKPEIVVFWFRRDLRWKDNHGLHSALSSGYPVLPIFIFDKNILDKLEDENDRRVSFIYEQLKRLNSKFQEFNSSLKIIHDSPVEAWKTLLEDYDIKVVYTNHDYEPYAIQRDREIGAFLKSKAISFHTYKDQVVFEKSELMKTDGSPYTVFTPYSRLWKSKLRENPVKSYLSENRLKNLFEFKEGFPSMESIGFRLQSLDSILVPNVSLETIKNYHDTRNIPSQDSGTTRLSVHLRFGTISIRELVRLALSHNETWLNELIWREFFMQILYHFPQVVENCFKAKYENIVWRNNEEEFQAWCEGRTGYSIVDAGMRELNETGFMHNRVRMIVASFLTKHLLIDWRWGEAYFAEKLLDYELSANNGNWQWSAGTGCDAAPYFRIFNPAEQTKKFDANNEYINKWLSANDLMIPPIVDHKFARIRALETYKSGLVN